jgi:hypothetical protein
VTRQAEKFDWEHVCESATRLRVAGPVRAALEAAVRWIDAPIPVMVLAHLLDSPGRRALALVQRWESRRLSEHVAGLATADLTADNPCVWRLGAAFARLHGWGPCLRGLRWAVLPTREFLAVWHNQAAAAGGFGYAITSARRCASALARGMILVARRLRLQSVVGGRSGPD